MNGRVFTWWLRSRADERIGMKRTLTGAALTETNHRPLSVCSSGCRSLCLIAVTLLSSWGWFQHHRREDSEELREGRCCACAELPWFLRLLCRRWRRSACWISAKAGTPESYQSTSRALWICYGDDESRQYTLPSIHFIELFPPFTFLEKIYYLYRLFHCFQNVK